MSGPDFKDQVRSVPQAPSPYVHPPRPRQDPPTSGGKQTSDQPRELLVSAVEVTDSVLEEEQRRNAERQAREAEIQRRVEREVQERMQHDASPSDSNNNPSNSVLVVKKRTVYTALGVLLLVTAIGVVAGVCGSGKCTSDTSSTEDNTPPLVSPTFLATDSPTAMPLRQFSLGQCDSLYFDLETGRLNGVPPTVNNEEVKEAFPCFTGETAETGGVANCGGGVFFLNHDFYFYTFRDFLEIRSGFAGTTSVSVLNRAATDVIQEMGTPTQSSGSRHYYQKDWGILLLEVSSSSGFVVEVDAHYNETVSSLDYCV